MTSAAVIARGRCDGDDRLISADEPLSSLQLACGGQIPGTVAIPALLGLVRKARQHGTRLARPFNAQDDEHAISAWVEIEPDDEAGYHLSLSNWRTTPLGEDADPAQGDPVSLNVLIADAVIRLDTRQAVQAVAAHRPVLRDLVQKLDKAQGQPWTDFVTIAGNGHRQPLHWRLLDNARVHCREAPGSWRARLLPQFGEGHRLIGFDLYLIPEQVEARPALVPAPAEDSGSDLARVIGRELAPLLRQPIGRIIANAETIRSRLAGPLPDEYGSYAGDIADAARHLLALVDDIADLEAIEAPDFSTEPDQIDLVDAARRAAGLLSVRARERGIAVELPPEGETLAATGEFRRVLQILLNLLGNALRYTPDGSTVRILAEPTATAQSLTVADNGPGLSAEQRAVVFEKFERLGRSGDGGSGLGLYISRRLARAMNGELEVSGEPGEGARFTLSLPPAQDTTS